MPAAHRKTENKTTPWRLFLDMFRIGAFTFGGGYTMLVLLQDEMVEKRKWMEKDEFLDMVAIAESTPGPVAINAATYIGYKTAGLPGAVTATVGVVLPSFLIILLISLFFDAFLSLKLVQYAFRGIQVGVVYLILSAGWKMFSTAEKTPFSVIMTAVACLTLLTLSLLAVSFSTVWLILISGAVGLAAFFLAKLRKGDKK